MRVPTFTSPLHDQRAVSLLGLALGVAFITCFVTGLISHVSYDPPSWWPVGSRPAGLYRVTQGLHVATGIAAVPLLLVKLWVVYPSFWTWPPVRSVSHGFERLLLLPLVGGSLFLLFSGVGNIARWRPWDFFFTDGHYAAAWVTIGALIAHIGAKVTVVRSNVRLAAPSPALTGSAMSRRQLLGTAAAASAVLTVSTVGQTLRPLAAISVLGPRDPRVGPQGLPVNRTAASAGVLPRLRDPAFLDSYRLVVARGGHTLASLSLDELHDLEVSEAELPIACVEGWSASARWRGVAVRDLLETVAASDSDEVEVVSLQTRGAYGRSRLTRSWLRDPDTLLAYDLNGSPLADDHGAPLRLIAPNRPGVLQTKWVHRVELS